MPSRPDLRATSRRVRLAPSAEQLQRGFERIRDQMHLPEGFAPDVRAQVESLEEPDNGRLDAREVEFVTIDPPGSKDLDQAFHAEREGSGFVVRYAIADVAAFVAPGSPMDVESHRRGQTLYCPDERVRLYPKELSDDRGSLLSGQTRPSVLWTFHLDNSAVPKKVEVQRAVIESRRQMTYEGAQAEIDAGADGSLGLLKEIGELREQLEVERGGISLNVPEQEVHKVGDTYELAFRVPLAVEDWNAQISLMTGMAAAKIMLAGGVGLLRTMPPPDQEALDILRRSSTALGVTWPEAASYADFARTLDAAVPAQAALIAQATRLFRGVGYVAFDGKLPSQIEHHAIAAPYAHVTAPLRRMADRYATEIVLSIVERERPPVWCLDALPKLPDEMKEADRRDSELDRRIIDQVESVILADKVGKTFDAVVVEVGKRGGTIQLMHPAVLAPCEGPDLPLGQPIRVRLVEVDPDESRIRFEVDGS